MADKANDDQDMRALMQVIDTLSKSVLATVLFTRCLTESHQRLIVVCDMLAEKTGLTQDEVDAELRRREEGPGPSSEHLGFGDLPPEHWN